VTVHGLLVASLSWNPQIKGGLYVLIAILILPGSGYMLLATNTGARLGFMLAFAGFTGFMVILGSVWWIYGIGPKGPAPIWKSNVVAVGDLGNSNSAVLSGYPSGWHDIEATDPEVADAQPVVDASLTGGENGGGRFKASNEYLVVGAFEKGGETYGPFGLDFRPFDVFHKPHFLAVQVQPVLHQQAVVGQPAPKPAPDPSKEPVTVVMIRDLGSKRENPGVATIASALLFGLVCYQLHVRDKEAMAKRG
jgi:hypothetical protein